jgi:hypothetical protein
MEGSLVAYKVFTNGSVLQASEINDNLMRQSVMVFSSSAARAAAITVPLEGMLTWLEDVNRYESYNGTAWVIPFGTRLLNTTTFTSATSVIVDNVFSSQYDAYQVLLQTTSMALAGGAVNLQFRTSGGSTVTTNNQSVRNQTYLTANSVLSYTANTFMEFGRNDLNGGLIFATINNPFATTRTYGLSHSVDSINAAQTIGFANTSSSSFAGIIMSFTQSSTGIVKVYGLEK